MEDLARVVVVTSSRRMRRYITRALASAGWEVHACTFDEGALNEQLAQPRNMYIIDADDDPGQIRSLLKQLHDHGSGGEGNVSSLLVSYDVENRLILELLASENLNNLIARHGGLSATQDLIDESELIVTCQKLFRRDIFGLDKYIATWGVKVREHIVRSDADKRAALNHLDQFLEQIDCHGAITPAISLVADELLMNAVFNAPRDADGNPKYAEKDRSKPIELDEDEAVEFRFSCDGRYVALAVADNFGALDRNVILRYLERCFLGARGEIEEKTAGAGLGLFMVFNSITQLAFNIHEGKRTEVIALFYIRGGARAFKLSGRSLNIFLLRD